jgi:uncharacterized protein YecT (DUF1311 family)
MRPSLVVLLLVPLSLAASAGHSQNAGPAATAKSRAQVPRIDCATASATPELNHCAEIRLKKADIELASALEKVRGQIAKRGGAKPYDPAAWKAGLDDAQKAWGLYREADCKGLVPHEWQGGTGATLAVLECMAQMTEARAFELTERYAEGR